MTRTFYTDRSFELTAAIDQVFDTTLFRSSDELLFHFVCVFQS